MGYFIQYVGFRFRIEWHNLGEIKFSGILGIQPKFIEKEVESFLQTNLLL